MSEWVILLDLNWTLVENSWLKRRQQGSYADKIGHETYRRWLVELVRPHTVVLCTVRSQQYQAQTLERLLLQTGWRPNWALFNPDPRAYRGDVVKRAYLLEHIFPRWGRPGEGFRETPVRYLAIESLQAARRMYAGYGIEAVRQQDCRRGLPGLRPGSLGP